MSKKSAKKVRRFLATGITAAMAMQALPVMQILAVYDEMQAQEEAFREELAAQKDQYPEGAFAFYEESSDIKEGELDRAVKVVRLGDASVAATVDVKSVDITAAYGDDYEVYYLDGLNKVYPEKKEISEPAAPEEAQTAEDSKNVSALRSAYAQQTGETPVNTNWRGEYEEYAARIASIEAEKQIINTVDGVQFTLDFQPGEYEKTLYIHVNNDTRAESDEAAALLLGNASVGMMGSQIEYTINIKDNEADEAIVFAMDRSEIIVDKDADYAEVTIKRTSGLDYYAGAVYQTAAGTAQPNVDYIPADSVQLSFRPGETEHTIRIPIEDVKKVGSYFTVMLDTGSVNAEEGKESVRIWLGEKPENTYSEEAVNEFGFPEFEVAPAPKFEEETGLTLSGGASVAAAAETIDGVVYDVATYWPSGQDWNFWAYTHAKSDLNTTDRTTRSLNLKEGVKVRFNTTLSGSSKTWPIWYYGKNGSLYINGSRKIYHEVSDKKSNETKHYEETVDMDYWQSNSNSARIEANTDGLCRDARYQVNWYKVYYPRYTIQMVDVNPNQKSRVYTEANKYTEQNVSSLTQQSSNLSQTVSRGGSMSITPGTLRNGIQLTGYEVYIGNRKITTSGPSISYSWLNDNIRKNAEGDLKNAKYAVRIKPIYKILDAKVTFKSENSDALVFQGFNNNFTLSCRQIDQIKYTVVSPKTTSQEFRATTVRHSMQGKNAQVQNNSSNVLNYTNTVDVDTASEELYVSYSKPTLKVQYTPEEVKAANNDAGVVNFSLFNDPSKTIGVSTSKDPFTLPNANYQYDINAMANTYFAQVIMGEKFKEYTTYTPSGNITFATKTLWTYRDPKANGRYVTTYGNSFVFSPFYADTVLNYHFKDVQVDEHQEGVSGKVYTKERALFSTDNNKKSIVQKPAVGVNLNVGGYAVTSDSEGKYSVDAHFNKGENVGAYVRYDTLASAYNIPISIDTKQDFVLDVATNEAINVDYANTKLFVEEPQKDDQGKVQRDITTNKISTIKKEVINITKEDKTYHLQVAATSQKAGITPAYAEFRVYSKSGKEKTALTKKVNFAAGSNNNYVAVLDVNPATDNLEVGDCYTVKFYDKNGQGYYEHQTSIIVAEKLEGMYMFNYPGIKQESDNAFVKAVGGLSIAYDFALNAVTNEYGIYEDASGEMRDMFCFGADVSLSNKSGSLGFNKPEELFRKEQQLKDNFENLRNGTFKTELPRQSDKISLFGNDGMAFGVDISTCVIMDSVLERDDPKHLGEYKFGDFFIVGNVSANFSNQWTTAVGPFTLAFALNINAGDTKSGTSPGVRWHFYNADNQPYYITSNSTIDLLADGKLAQEGDMAFGVNVVGKASVSALGDMIGVSGGLEVAASHHAYYYNESGTSGWKNTGAVSIKPFVTINCLIKNIPVWHQEWVYNYGNSNASGAKTKRQLSADVQEAILFAPTFNATSAVTAAASNTEALATGKNESVLKSVSSKKSDLRMQDLGNGKYLAVFLDVVPGREEANALGAYYTVFDGNTWSQPKLLEDDGTIDQLPTICQAGSKGWLIAWSDASRKLTADDTMTGSMNTLNLTGRFFNAENEVLGDIMEITRTTTEDDENADTNPQIVYYSEGDQEYMKLYYTKSEFSISDEASGEVVGDLLNPYQLIAVRNYDFVQNEWREDYIGSAKENVLSFSGEEKYDAYVKNWYGQEFLTLAPGVDITEELDENGYWAEGKTAQITELKGNQAVAKDGDSIAYNHLSLFAYALDKGGMSQETNDQNLYLQIYNFHEDTYHHPIQITSNNAEISDIKFVRIPVVTADGTTEVTYLYWLEDGVVKRINISDLVSNHLKAGETTGGQNYYYVDKTFSEEDTAYEPAQIVASGYRDAEDDTFKAITNFKTYQQGDYHYTVWTQFVPAAEGEHTSLQVFAVRENTVTGEATAPVQLTDTANQYVQNFDCVVQKDGSLEILAECMAIGDDDQPDVSTAVIKSIKVVPGDVLKIEKAEQSGTSYDSDGKPVVVLDVIAANRSLKAQEDVVVEVRDADGKVVSTTAAPTVTYEMTEEEQEDGSVLVSEKAIENAVVAQKLDGGNTMDAALTLPVSADGSYSGTIVVTSNGKELASQKIEGKVEQSAEVQELTAEVTSQGHVQLDGIVQNTSVLDSDNLKAVYGYVNDKGERVKLGELSYETLKAGEQTAFTVDAEVDFNKFTENTAEDGSLISTMKFYVDTDAANTTASYATVTLTATESEATLMNALKGHVSAKTASYDENGNLKAETAIQIGDTVGLELFVGDDFAQNQAEYVNRTKIVWAAEDNSVVSVDENGCVTAVGNGTTTIKGYVMPCDTVAMVSSDGYVEEADRSVELPASMLVPVEAVITVGSSTEPTTEPTTSEPTETTPPETLEPTGSETTEPETKYFAEVPELCEMAEKDYASKNNQTPAKSEAVKNDDGTLSITLTGTDNTVLDVYTIDPVTGKGTDKAGKAVDLPKTGVQAKTAAGTAAAALAAVIAGGYAMLKSGIFRRKKRDEE